MRLRTRPVRTKLPSVTSRVLATSSNSQLLLSQYAAMHPADREISGPRLLDWARRTFHRPILTDYTETVEAIFRELGLAGSER
jgi:hypothetical protein